MKEVLVAKTVKSQKNRQFFFIGLSAIEFNPSE
jgi:hypothetical protein